jgi:hypothetical protein
VYTDVTDPNHLMGRQGGYTSKVAWADPAAVTAGAGSPSQGDAGGTEHGGGIEIYPDAAGVLARSSTFISRLLTSQCQCPMGLVLCVRHLGGHRARLVLATLIVAGFTGLVRNYDAP